MLPDQCDTANRLDGVVPASHLFDLCLLSLLTPQPAQGHTCAAALVMLCICSLSTWARQAQQAQLGTYRGNQLSPTSSIDHVLILTNYIGHEGNVMTLLLGEQRTPERLRTQLKLRSRHLLRSHQVLVPHVWGLDSCRSSALTALVAACYSVLLHIAL